MFTRCLFLLVAAGLISFSVRANVVDFSSWQSGSNTVRFTDGNTAKISQIKSIDKVARTANVVIDASDKFGNKIRVNKVLSFSADKFKLFASACVRAPLLCSGAAAITIGVVATLGLDWLLDPVTGYWLKSEAPMDPAMMPDCSSGFRLDQYMTFTPDGLDSPKKSVYIRLYDINCVVSRQSDGNYNYRISLSSQLPGGVNSPDYLDLISGYGNDVSFSTAVDGYIWTPELVRLTTYEVYATIPYSASDAVEPRFSEVPAVDVLEAFLSPGSIQIAPGMFADVFEDIPPLDSTDEEDINPVEDPFDGVDWIGGEPDESMLIGADALETKEIAVDGYFTTESFLPAECPAPYNIELPLGGSFNITFDLVCQYASMIKGFVVLAGMLTWLMIVWRGVNV